MKHSVVNIKGKIKFQSQKCSSLQNVSFSDELRSIKKETGFTYSQVKRLFRRFHHLDKDGRGYLRKEDLMTIHEVRPWRECRESVLRTKKIIKENFKQNLSVGMFLTFFQEISDDWIWNKFALKQHNFNFSHKNTKRFNKLIHVL